MDNSALQLLQQYQSNATTQQQQQQQTYQQQVNLNPVSVLSAQPQQQQPFYEDLTSNSAVGGGGGGIIHHHQPPQSQDDMSRSAKRTAPSASDNSSSSSSSNNNAISSVVTNLLPLLEPTSPSGSLLRQYYDLSTNNIFNLPPIPSNELYCVKLIDIGIPCRSPSDIPLYDQSALNAARFSELALGALADDQLNLALELGNACVLCLRNCTEE